VEVVLGLCVFALALSALWAWQVQGTVSNHLKITGFLLDRAEAADGEIKKLQERVRTLEGWTLPDYTDWANLDGSDSSSGE